MEKEKTLPPCPFCGSINLDVYPDDRGVLCMGCGVFMSSVYSTDKTRAHGAVEGWCRRDLMESRIKEAFMEGAGAARSSVINSDILWDASETKKTIDLSKGSK